MSKKKYKKYKKIQEKAEKVCKKQRAEKGYADVDVYEIFTWFMEIMPKMLRDLRDKHIGHPTIVYTKEEMEILNNPSDETRERYEELSDEGEKRWNDILDHMIFLLQEMNEETCSMKNPYEKKAHKLQKKFRKKYGMFGTKYKTKEELKEEKDKHVKILKTASDVPENKAFFKKYYDCEKKTARYRNKCKNEFFKLFSKYFWCLWD